MVTTLIGYVFFLIAAYSLLIIGADVHTAEQLQEFVPMALRSYIHIPGFVFVMFGIVASMFISYNFSDMISGLKSLYFVFIGNRINFNVYLEAIKDIAQYTNTNDVESLEEYANQIKYPFLKDGLLLLVNGYKKEEVKEILMARIENERQRENSDVLFFKSLVAYAPGWGMLGTTIGLIQMFSAKIDASGGFGPILNGLAVAFTTTLYGLFFMNFVFQPIVDKVKQRTEEEVLMKLMIVDGLCMIRDKKHPIFIQDKLSSFIPAKRSLGLPKVAQLSS